MSKRMHARTCVHRVTYLTRRETEAWHALACSCSCQLPVKRTCGRSARCCCQQLADHSCLLTSRSGGLSNWNQGACARWSVHTSCSIQHQMCLPMYKAIRHADSRESCAELSAEASTSMVHDCLHCQCCSAHIARGCSSANVIDHHDHNASRPALQ